MPEFQLFVRDTFSRNYVFEESYFQVQDWTLSEEKQQFPSDIYRFLNVSPGQSASFFLFRKGVKPVYDDPEHSGGGGEFSFYFHLKNEMVKLDEALHQMIEGLLTNSIIEPDKHTSDLPYGDITGLSIIPKRESVTVKLWLSKNSCLRDKTAVEIFPSKFKESWKLQDAKYLSFERPVSASTAPAAPTTATSRYTYRSNNNNGNSTATASSLSRPPRPHHSSSTAVYSSSKEK